MNSYDKELAKLRDEIISKHLIKKEMKTRENLEIYKLRDKSLRSSFVGVN